MRLINSKKLANAMFLMSIAMVLPVATEGCSRAKPPAPQLVDVRGTVTLNGKPVTNVMVVFLSEGGEDSSGVTNSQGNFRLMYHGGKESGAVPGKHQVQFITASPDQPATLLPARYLSGESGISVEVTSPGPNEIPLELKGR